MQTTIAPIDIAMLGTFAVWGRGTLQARALPLAQALGDCGVRCAIVTSPWDMSEAAGTVELNAGIPLISTKHCSPRHAPLAVTEQLGWLRRLQPRIVHVFKPKGFGALAATWLFRRCPVIVDSDDWEGDGGWNDQAGYGFLQRRLFNWQECDLQRRANAVTAASTLLQRRAIALRDGDAESVRCIPNGLPDAWRAALLAAQPADLPLRCVLLYSRFAEFPANWLPRYVAALDARLTEPVSLRVVGSLPDAVHAQLPASDMVTIELHGYVARERLPELLGDATLAIYPYEDSLITRSKQSVKLLELMAAGCPVIASDVGDVSETLGTAGLTLPGSDPAAFASTTLSLLEQPTRLHSMRDAGPERVRTAFSFERLAAELHALYAELGLPCNE